LNGESEDQMKLLKDKMYSQMDKNTLMLIEIINFGRNNEVHDKANQSIVSFTDGSRTPWDIEFNSAFDFDIDSTNIETECFDSDISELNRVDLGFDQQAFSYQVCVTKNDDERETVPSVMNDNIEHWLGFGSLDTAATTNQNVNEMIGEEEQNMNNDYEEALDPEEAYDNIEDTKYLVILWRFDQGAGHKIIDLTDNKNNGNILSDNVAISNEQSTSIWEEGQLEPDEPLAFEDEWGKQSPPN